MIILPVHSVRLSSQMFRVHGIISCLTFLVNFTVFCKRDRPNFNNDIDADADRDTDA